MYKILIADDERAERSVIRFLINKYELPLEITEAQNGKEALELLAGEHFHILFTDIKMPFLTGLDLAAQIHTKYPAMRIVFFSGYDDFEYVKEALSLQVVNYILKPVNPEEFKQTITKIIDSLKADEAAEQLRQTTWHYVNNHILYQLINSASPELLQKQHPHFDFSVITSYHRLFLLQADNDLFGGYGERQFQAFLEPLKDMCDYLNLNPAQSLILFRDPGNHFSWYESQAQFIHDRIYDTCHTRCYVLISEEFISPEMLAAAYQAAEHCSEFRFFMPNTYILSEQRVLTGDSEDPEQDDLMIQNIEEDIRYKDKVHLHEHVRTLLNKYERKSTLSQIYIKFFMTNLMRILILHLPADQKISLTQMTEKIYSTQHFSDISQLITDTLEILTQSFKADTGGASHAVELVKQYIHTHYGEDLGLEILAAQVYFTPGYLSGIFSQETGFGINKYIKNIRMAKAKELLLHTNMKIHGVCRQVGYTNVSYFCKSFQEDFGMTPEKYRISRKAAPT